MDLIDWLPSITTTSLLAAVLWLSRKLIGTRLTKSVEYEFNRKLEEIRAEFREKEELLKADLRSKEAEIAALRSGAMTAMASRQMAVDRRRLEAVDQLWSAVAALGPAKNLSSYVAVLNIEAIVEDAAQNPKIRETFAAISPTLDPDKIDLSGSEKARPFVSPMTWALFSAYRAITVDVVLKLQILKRGLFIKGLYKETGAGLARLVKAALPDQAEYIDKYGDAAHHHLLEELERRLLDEMRKVLTGSEGDRASVEQAAEILRLSNEFLDSAKKSSIPSSALPATPGSARS